MKYVAKKLLTLVVTLFVVSLLAFLAFQVIPGDPTTKILGTEATEEAVHALRQELGLDRNVFVRYFLWLGDFLTGNWGTSYSYHMGVRQMLSDKLPITLLLTVLSFLMTVVISIPLGVLAGGTKSSLADGAFSTANQLVMSIPAFFLGILATYIFGTILKLFTPGNFVSYTQSWRAFLGYLILPALSISIPRIAMTVKMLRTSIHTQLGEDYVRTARSRGNGRWAILLRHVLPNAMMSVVSFLAVSAAEIMTGSIVIEQIFAIPGVSRLLLSSISGRDFPVVQAIVVLMAAWVVLVHFLADLLQQLLNPRLRTP